VKVAEALLALSAARDAAPAEVTVAYEDSGAPKHYWRVLCRQEATELAAAIGVDALASGTQATLSADDRGQVDRVAAARRAMWATGMEQFTEWRRTDPTYLTIEAADKGVAWGKSAKKDAELAWLEGFTARAAADAAEVPLDAALACRSAVPGGSPRGSALRRSSGGLVKLALVVLRTRPSPRTAGVAVRRWQRARPSRSQNQARPRKALS
jgi:hypothetical protein